ncbi:MAG: metallopeptidase family protein [bacterium]
MDIKKFRLLAARVIDSLPDEFRNALENIEVVVEDWPTDEELDYFEDREGLDEGEGEDLLLGLYQGIPLNQRGPMSYNGALPDKITLFRKSIEEYSGGNEDIMKDEIRKTLLHEIGHYFGIEEDRLQDLGY